MPLRIAIAEFAHETNTFAAERTGLDAFQANRYLRGEELRELIGTNTVCGGAFAEIERVGPAVEVVPLVATSAIPGGLVTREAFETVVGEIARGLAAARPDAVLLDLHGAMVTESGDDGEADTLARVRAVVGSDLPIVTVLDLHANLSQEMVDRSDVLLPYDTYPHVDCAERGAEAVRLLRAMSEGQFRPVSALRTLPMLTALPPQRTEGEPMRSIMAMAAEFEARSGVVNVGVTPGFAYADIPIAGFAVVVTTDGDRPLADRSADELAAHVWSRREEFRPRMATVEEAVHVAMAALAGPVVLADVGDNPGGGAACDGTALLWALLDLGTRDAALAVMADPEVVAAAFAAGVGGRVALPLGGKTDERHGYPIDITAAVQSLSDGAFVYEGPMAAGVHGSMGKTAVLACEGRYGNTVEVIVCERRVQALDQAVFRSQGIEPTERAILVVKSAVHFRGSFEPIAAEIIEVDTPGLTAVDLDRFAFRRIRRPIWPFDPM